MWGLHARPSFVNYPSQSNALGKLWENVPVAAAGRNRFQSGRVVNDTTHGIEAQMDSLMLRENFSVHRIRCNVACLQ